MRQLAMDFQPIFMSGYSLIKQDPSHWQRKVRPSVVSAEQPTCSACSFVAIEQRRLIHADEVWVFASPPHVALVDVRPLCVRCHEAKDYSYLLDLIAYGDKPKLRDAEIRKHYCDVNACTNEEFDADFAQALATKRDVEERYGPNCRPVVDYGRWARSKEKPRLTPEELRLLRSFTDDLDEPVFIARRKFKNFGSAVRTMQSIPLSDRRAVFAEMESFLDRDDEDGEFEMFPDHECPWDIKMQRD